MRRMNNLTWCFLIIALFYISACTPAKEEAQDGVVDTKFGQVSGSFNDPVHAFKGIPYAQAERFMPPQDPDAWEGVRESNEFSPVAKQVVAWIDESNMDEDKLFSLNIWTQGINDGKKRPVMVWLHGGGFHVGSSNDPMTYGEAMAKKGDIVFVSLNHRLNILGFLDLSAAGAQYEHAANVGMLDIVKALEWVRDNIAAFGGDPSDVTIVGESGGGGKVGTLMCMPDAEGLFRKAIIQSGTLINTMTREKSQQLGMAVLGNLGITADEVEKINAVDYADLVEAGNDAIARLHGPRTPGSPTMFGFAPSVDGKILVQQPFSPGFAEFSKDIPLMIGTTLNELVRTSYGEKELTIEEAKERLASTYGDKTDQYVALYATSYPEYTPQDLLSVDGVFRPFTIRTADAWSATSNAPVYTYLLGWKSDVDDASRGSFHGLDIPLAFYTVDLRADWTGDTEEAWQLSDKMSAAWINFVKTGNPNVDGILPQWEPYTPENGATMYFDNESHIVHNHDRALMNFIMPLD